MQLTYILEESELGNKQISSFGSKATLSNEPLLYFDNNLIASVPFFAISNLKKKRRKALL